MYFVLHAQPRTRAALLPLLRASLLCIMCSCSACKPSRTVRAQAYRRRFETIQSAKVGEITSFFKWTAFCRYRKDTAHTTAVVRGIRVPSFLCGIPRCSSSVVIECFELWVGAGWCACCITHSLPIAAARNTKFEPT